MSSVTVRNIPEATHRALKLRAAQHGRSTEAEIRAILESAVTPIAFADCAIAAIAKTHGFIVATRNVRDFQGAGVDIINPWVLN